MQTGSFRPFSVIIPAHNEASTISRCLTGILHHSPLADIVVVANGCDDDTAALARSFTDVRVIEVEKASKSDALNAGDAAATHFPRIYLDAHIVLEPDAADMIVEALASEPDKIASARAQFDLAAASAPVRMFYSVFTQLPYNRTRLIGLGVYALSYKSRERFAQFPKLIADDLFVQRLFAPDDRVIVDSSFNIVTPQNLVDLIKVRVRVARGNRELSTNYAGNEFGTTSRETSLALMKLLMAKPHHLLNIAVYIGVSALARFKARRASDEWMRDESSRRAVSHKDARSSQESEGDAR